MSTAATINNNIQYDESKLAEYDEKIKDLTPSEQEAVRKFWRSVVMRTPRAFSEENGRLPQYATNVRSCNCCPYGYHIDLDFVRYCEALANATPSDEELLRRSRRRSRKSMEFMLGLDGLFDQWDAAMRVEALPEASHESDSLDSPRPALTSSTPYSQRPRSSSVPRFTYTGPTRSESPFGTASSTCSSLRGGVESDAPYPARRRLNTYANSPPETRAFLRDALDEVCDDFERTLERTSVRRKKAATLAPATERGVAYASLMTRSDRNNNNNSNSFNDRKINGHGPFMTMSCLEKKRNCHAWDQYFDKSDSCVGGNRSPPRFSSLPYQQKLSPAEQQYEQYVQATVAANAKSPIELEAIVPTRANSPPPPPPPRRQGASVTAEGKTLPLSSSSTEVSPMSSETLETTSNEGGGGKSPLQKATFNGHSEMTTTTSSISETKTTTTLVNNSSSTVVDGAASADAQTLFNIRQQMALSLRRMQDLEEQVKNIPELQHELTRLRDEKQRLHQSLQRKEDELQRARDLSRLSASPSPVASPKYASSAQFTPQRISPVSLESLGARLRTSSTSSERLTRASPPLKRDVGTMCGLHTTRDVAVGSPLAAQRTVGTSPVGTASASITDTLYTQLELEEHARAAIRRYEEQRSLQQLRKLISVGTQMYVPPTKREARDNGCQTAPERVSLKLSVGVTARPATRETYVSCQPIVRTVGVSDDCIADELCAKCAVSKRSVSSGTEQAPPVAETRTPTMALHGRSLTFSLGESDSLSVRRKTQGTQYTATTVQNIGSQTALALVHSVGVQSAPETLTASTQSVVDCAHRQTDTRDLMRLCATQTSVEEVAAPAPQPEPLPSKPATRTMASNTEAAPATKDSGVNTPAAASMRSFASNTDPPEPAPVPAPKAVTRSTGINTDTPRTLDNGVNTPPPAGTRTFASNTEEVPKRDFGCGGDQAATLKPHISIACAANYCDSCKDAIKHLAQDFATKAPSTGSVPASPLPTRAVDSKIPRPKHLTSPGPVRRTFQRQNTYTVPTPLKTLPSPSTEKKQMSRSLSEKPPSLASFHQQESAAETQSFIVEPTRRQQQQRSGSPKRASSSGNGSPQASPPKQAPSPDKSPAVVVPPEKSKSHEYANIGADDLVVREETRVSISWSRDASPAPQADQSQDNIGAAAPTKSLESSLCEKLKAIETTTSAAKSEPEADVANIDCSKGARKKTLLPLKKSSQTESVLPTEDAPEQKPPSRALLQKLAMVEAEPRQKYEPNKEMLSALMVINQFLLKKTAARSFSSSSLKAARNTIVTEWFRISSTDKANPHEVEDYLDCFERLSVPLLEYCVNMVDVNGNTAMHYSVSHGNFDVVSILLDSKVCNVNQMNNAGYTCVMLVSLAKLMNAAHRTVVERLFQMADVNIRAKKHSQTSLMLAVSHGNLDMVTLLLAAGADINIQDEDGSTALMCAAEHGRVDIVKLFLSQPECDSLIQDVDKSTAFKIAWQAGHRDLGLLLYVHEQMLRSKLPNRGEGYGGKLALSPREPRPHKPTQ